MESSPTVAVEGPGWVDQSVNRIRGLFPLSVERYLNQAIGDFVPSVTTVTNVARSYPLHGLVMAEASARGLDSDRTRLLLRRAEVVMSLASIAHAPHPDHPSWMPDPHGRDKLRAAWEQGPIDLNEVTGTGPSAYATDPWGFLNPYFGSEFRLGILGSPWTTPGPGFDEDRVRSALGEVLHLAERWTSVTQPMAEEVGHLCICAVTTSTDGRWLASRLAGDPSEPHTVASTLADTMTLVAKALTAGDVSSEEGLADTIRFGTLLAEDSTLSQSPVAHRWRGISLRQTAVLAWRELWFSLSIQAHEAGGFMPISDLQDWFADQAPNRSLGTFVDSLPPSMASGQTLPAERQLADDLDQPMLSLTHVLLSGRRAAELEGDQQWGYLGEPANLDRNQELSPLWVGHTIDRWRDRPMKEFSSYLVKVLLDRSQRVALDKASYRDGRYVLPARVLLRDGFVEWRDHEGAAAPPLRLERIVHIGRQVGLFDINEAGHWKIGRLGDYIAR